MANMTSILGGRGILPQKADKTANQAHEIIWENIQPEDYQGEFPMIQITDSQESYCAPLGAQTAEEAIEAFCTGCGDGDGGFMTPEEARARIQGHRVFLRGAVYYRSDSGSGREDAASFDEAAAEISGDPACTATGLIEEYRTIGGWLWMENHRERIGRCSAD